MEDNSFFPDFDVAEPVFARKSAPPPSDEESPMMADENSSAAANNAGAAGVSSQEEGEEPMDQDAQPDPHTPNMEGCDPGQGKRSRSRSRKKRSESRLNSKSPDVNKLLESLGDPNLPPLPMNPVPTHSNLPPPPPPPPLPQSSGTEIPQGADRMSKSSMKGAKKTGKEKNVAQRTKGVGPKIRGSSGTGPSFETPTAEASSSSNSGSSNSSSNSINNVRKNVADDPTNSAAGPGAGTNTEFRSHALSIYTYTIEMHIEQIARFFPAYGFPKMTLNLCYLLYRWLGSLD